MRSRRERREVRGKGGEERGGELLETEGGKGRREGGRTEKGREGKGEHAGLFRERTPDRGRQRSQGLLRSEPLHPLKPIF